MEKRISARKLTTMAMLSALAYIFMLVSLLNIRIVPLDFLKYDPKDFIVVLTGFIYGPLEAGIVLIAEALLEFVTVSSTGLYGLLMNIVATGSFSVTASLVYRRHRSVRGAIVALVCAVLALTASMSLWNIIITPFYMGMPRSAILPYIVPMFIPFNAVKGTLNAVLIMFTYKPMLSILKAAKLAPVQSESGEWPKFPIALAVVLAAVLAVIIWVMSGANAA